MAAQPTDRAQREAELEEIRDQITALRGQLFQLDERQEGLAGDLGRTTLEARIQERRVAEVRAERALAESALGDTEWRVSVLESLLESSRDKLRERLVDLYRIGAHGSVRLLLSIRSEEQLIHGIRTLRYLARREGETIARYTDTHIELDFEQGELTRQRQEVEALLEQEASRLETLRALEGRQRRLLAEVEEARITVTAQTATLLDKERKLANLLDFLYGRTTTNLAGTPLQEFRGVLDWPVAGEVVTGFGPRLDRRYQTRVPHNGIEIAPDSEGSVKVVFPGKVVFAAPFQGYGLTVVVHHPARVFTLYAGLANLEVASDDMLSLGDVLGQAGDSLYFEIRVENQPEDPLLWLR
jgi:septal ring factor EnvC (AmiA/AmiB activator)